MRNKERKKKRRGRKGKKMGRERREGEEGRRWEKVGGEGRGRGKEEMRVGAGVSTHRSQAAQTLPLTHLIFIPPQPVID